MTEDLKGALEQIKKFLEKNGGDLASILSAMRGPDSEDSDLKCRTTNRFRRAAFGDWGKMFGYTSSPDLIGEIELQEDEVEVSPALSQHFSITGRSHFITHALYAARALEILIRIKNTLYKATSDYMMYVIVEEGRDRETDN